jgi:hypothetical protein
MRRLVGLALFLMCCGVAQAARQEIAATCTTESTGTDGIRHRCNSESVKQHAPAGFVFEADTLDGGKVSSSGSDHACNASWDDFVVDTKTGRKLPTTVVLSAYARGPQEKLAGRGWVNCRYSVEVVKYP